MKSQHSTIWIQAWRDLYECPWPTAGTIKDRCGDLGLALAMWAARRHTGLTLKDIGAALDGFDCAAVAMAVRRLESRAPMKPLRPSSKR